MKVVVQKCGFYFIFFVDLIFEKQIIMVVYFDYRLDIDRSGINIDIQWYDGSLIFVVNIYSDDIGGFVNFFFDEVYILFCFFLNFLNNYFNKKM